MGLIHNYLFEFENLFYQLATSFLIGAILVLLFRKKFLASINKTANDTEDKIHEKGLGTISGNQVKFNGTYWNTNNDLNDYENGSQVNVVIVDNMAIIKKDTHL